MKATQLPLVAKPRPDCIREAVMPLPEETPASRLILHGPEVCSDTEIVSIIMGTSMEAARMHVSDGLYALSQRDARFARTKGAQRLAAALELGRRVAAQAWCHPIPVTTPDDLARGLIARHAHKPQEELGAVYLNARHVVIREVPAIYRGTVNHCVVSCRDVLRIGLALNATALVLFHAHPSGSPEPSTDDMAYTRKLNSACNEVGMELLDHLVLGMNRYMSMKEKGYF